MAKKSIIIALLLVVLPKIVSAQIYPLADQYLLNFFQVNPAVAGVTRYDPLVFNARQQGLKWDHAPGSQSVTFQSKLFKEKSYFNQKGFLNRGKNAFGKVGLGGGFFNYSYGSVSQTGFHLDYSYHVYLANGRLSFGLSPVFMQFKANFNDDTFTFDENPDDLWQPQGNDPIRVSILDFNAGVHYYSDQLTLGFSCLQMFSSSIHLSGEYGFPTTQTKITNPDLTRSMYGYGAYLFTINRLFKIEPMLMLRYNENAVDPVKLSTTATGYIMDNLETGVSYQWSDELSVFAGVRMDQFAVRYLFEMPLSGKTPRGFNAHMIQISFVIGQKIK